MRQSGCAETNSENHPCRLTPRECLEVCGGFVCDRSQPCMLGFGGRRRLRRSTDGRSRADRVGRYTGQVPHWRERDSRRIDGGGPRRPFISASRVRPYRLAARSDDERHQRRRARGERARLPGVHARADRRSDHRRSRAHARGDVSRASIDSRGSRPCDVGRRQGRLCPRGEAAGPLRASFTRTACTSFERAAFLP